MITDRHGKILEILSKNGRAEVISLSDILGVSQVTIRKDLDTLENRNLIRREHGYACLNNSDDTGKRMAFKYEIKRRIALAAAATVEEGETVMIESGSCCALLAEELAKAEKDITIITNSVFVANFIRLASRTKIILLGGHYMGESQILVGPMTQRCSEIFFSDKFFSGTDGFKPDYGFTGNDVLHAQTVAELARNATEIIVLTEAEKFSRRGVIGTLRLEKVASVYTDERISAETEQLLLDKNIALHKVPELGNEEV
jgi:DeoR/GlpR family transcriptional regulator of sugar metabolism